MIKEKRTNDRSDATTVVASIANDVLTYAVDYTRRRLGNKRMVAGLLCQDVPEAQDYFRFGLASRLGARLGEFDANVRSVYLHDAEEASDEMGSTPCHPATPLTLVVRVGHKTEALEALLIELDLAVTARYRSLVSPAASQLRSLLDFKLVDDQEAHERIGYGAIVTSLYTPPERVWTAV